MSYEKYQAIRWTAKEAAMPNDPIEDHPETITPDEWSVSDLRAIRDSELRTLAHVEAALEKLTADIRAYFRFEAEIDRMVQYGRDPGEDAYHRLDAMRAQLPS